MSSSESELSSSLLSLTSLENKFENTLQTNLNDFEPLATEQEHLSYVEQVAIEDERDREFKKRFSKEVTVESWCSCSKCSLEYFVKEDECFCCMEMNRCQDKMAELELEDLCITEHPGFDNVCLNKWVLETAAIGLKTRKNKSYAQLYKEKKCPESRFLRSVAYRQIVRFIWNYMGNSMRTPLPSCIYNAIRSTFPSEDGNYNGFEEEEKLKEQEEDEDELYTNE